MKIAIAGYGIEGESNYRYWGSPDNELTIVDESAQPHRQLPAGVKTLLGEGVFSQLHGFDLVVRTASLPPSRITTDGKVWSSTNEFFAKCPAPIIGVTGTKGKGTTASLITSILRAAGKTVHLVGNIGTPALDVLPLIELDDIVVFEMSSFQLWDVAQSPHIAVVLLIEAEHLNVHGNMDDYVAAKANIRRFQSEGDVCIYHPTNPLSEQVAHGVDVNQPIRYGVSDDGGVYVESGYFMHAEQQICSVKDLQLIGRHNIENACAAITVALQYDVSPDAIIQGLRSFTGLPHRLEFVAEYRGAMYYNDSFSSAPSASIAAIDSFTQPKVVIIGGIDRGADFTELCETLRTADSVKKVIVIGEIRHKLAGLLDGVDAYISDATTMGQIVQEAAQYADSGDVVILSPGCASFDMFKNFDDRGDQFKRAVEGL